MLRRRRRRCRRLEPPWAPTERRLLFWFLFCAPRSLAMVGGGVCYLLYVLAFLWPSDGLSITVGGIVGVGAAVLWTGEGVRAAASSRRHSRMHFVPRTA